VQSGAHVVRLLPGLPPGDRPCDVVALAGQWLVTAPAQLFWARGADIDVVVPAGLDAPGGFRAAATPDGRRLVVGTGSQLAEVDPMSRKVTRKLELPDVRGNYGVLIESVAISPDGARVAAVVGPHVAVLEG
jgi:hypothetical protein